MLLNSNIVESTVESPRMILFLFSLKMCTVFHIVLKHQAMLSLSSGLLSSHYQKNLEAESFL